MAHEGSGMGAPARGLLWIPALRVRVWPGYFHPGFPEKQLVHSLGVRVLSELGLNVTDQGR